MGIPAYFSHIVKNHSNIIQKFNKDKFIINNLLLDCNSIIYDCVRVLQKTEKINKSFENKLIKSVCDKIIHYIKTINPTTSVFISFDGVAPVAKLDQQRNRRYKSQFTNAITREIMNSNIDWDTTNITPGTQFMLSLSKQIHACFKNPSDFNLQSINVSTSLDFGEGEHKLYEDIRNNKNYRKETTVIYGLDADLIMLSLNHIKYCERIYLFRETPEFIKHLDSSLNPNELYVLDINNLSDNLINELNNNEPITNEKQKNRIFDYIFICFMLGNDFIPHIPSINIRTHGISHLLDAYKISVAKNNENITNGDNINWSIFRKFIKHLANNELDYYNLEYNTREKQSKRFFPSGTETEKFDKFMNLPIQNRQLEIYINPGEEYWQARYYKTLFNMENTENNIQQICINYLEALEWNFKYYTTGCSDWRWTYHYHYPPLMQDLLKYIPYFDTEFIRINNNKPVCDYVQLAYVLPKSSLHLLPPDKYKLLSKHINDFYSDNCSFQWSYCKYFWEAHVMLPHIDLMNLEDILQ